MYILYTYKCSIVCIRVSSVFQVRSVSGAAANGLAWNNSAMNKTQNIKPSQAIQPSTATHPQYIDNSKSTQQCSPNLPNQILASLGVHTCGHFFLSTSIYQDQ